MLVVVLVVSALWISGILLPYYVNDLDSLPMSDVTSGAHDPKDLWPAAAGAWGSALHGLGLLVAMGLGPTVLIGCAFWSTWSSLGRWRLLSRTTRTTYLLVVVVGTSMTAAMLSPFAHDLLTWALD